MRKRLLGVGCLVLGALGGGLLSGCGLTYAQAFNLEFTNSTSQIAYTNAPLGRARFYSEPGGRRNVGGGETIITVANDTYDRCRFLLIQTDLAPKDAGDLPRVETDAIAAGKPAAVVATTPLLKPATVGKGGTGNSDTYGSMHLYLKVGVHYLLIDSLDYKKGIAYEIYQAK